MFARLPLYTDDYTTMRILGKTAVSDKILYGHLQRAHASASSSSESLVLPGPTDERYYA